MIKELKKIEQDLLSLGDLMREEERVSRAELEERQRLGLHGEAAVKHYNEWMQTAGFYHLMVDEE